MSHAINSFMGFMPRVHHPRNFRLDMNLEEWANLTWCIETAIKKARSEEVREALQELERRILAIEADWSLDPDPEWVRETTTHVKTGAGSILNLIGVEGE